MTLVATQQFCIANCVNFANAISAVEVSWTSMSEYHYHGKPGSHHNACTSDQMSGSLIQIAGITVMSHGDQEHCAGIGYVPLIAPSYCRTSFLCVVALCTF